MKRGGERLGALVEQFMSAMHRFDDGRTLPMLYAAGVTTAQLAVLEFTRQPRRVSEVADFVGLSRPATSQLVDKLARAGLVKRRVGTTDRRQRLVVLSARGRTLVDRVAAARAARFRASLASVSPELARRLALVLTDVVSALAPDGATDGPRSRRRVST